MTLKDTKEALGTRKKPDLTHVRVAPCNYIARAKEYGSDKYERGNYLRRTKGTKEDFLRFGAYLRAGMSHTMNVLDSMEAHLAQDPALEDEGGMQIAAYAADTDTTPGAKVGASMLPGIAHAMASLSMAIAQATDSGLLPKDPGSPWLNEPAIEKALNESVQKLCPSEEEYFGALASAINEVSTEFASNVEKPTNQCAHDRQVGLACKECGGWARRE